MTAHRVAVACGMAVLAMGTMDPAAAFDDQQTIAFDRAAAIDRHYGGILPDRLDAGTGGFARGKARGEQPRSNFTPYAGIGIDKIKLSMDLESGDVALKKDKGFNRPRLILGMDYSVTEDLSLGFEYRALASDNPLFSLDMGSETMNVDTRFTRHNVFLTARYRF